MTFESALVLGGTRFIGRYAVEELLAHDYAVTLLTRGEHPNPFADDDRADHVEGDRTEATTLRAAALSVDPDVVVDTSAYHPAAVRAATDAFADAGAYVYVSSGDAYAAEEVPKREGETPLRPCTEEQATDDGHETYGNRKAAGDRAVFEAAADGVRAMSVRPTVVYGPHDYTGRLAYWVDRVAAHDRVVVPGDGQNLWHRAYVADVARALRVVAEAGAGGEAYNVGDRRLRTLADLVRDVADVLDADVEVVPASARELSVAGLSPEEFPLYREYPHVLDTTRLSALGWTSTPNDDALAETVRTHRDGDESAAADVGPDRDIEERVLGVLDTL
ncbi:MAG: NAD-dependent epimerase/dehydratase family protein [Halobacteriaceae archaeon]